MISECVIIFGGSGNVVMVLNGSVPNISPVMFRVGVDSIDLVTGDSIIYTERGLSAYICERLKRKTEIGLMEVLDQSKPPKKLTNIAYKMAVNE